MCENVVSYYSGLDASALGGAALKNALHALVSPHTVVSYADAWNALATLDADPSDATKIIGIYSNHHHDAVAARGVSTGWNREHSWPKSYGVDYSGPDFSDLHALYAADWNVNSARGNLYFDDCPLSAGCSQPAHAEAAASTAKDSARFQPPADRRGDLARAMFYMATRYDGAESFTTDLELADVPDARTSTMGKLSTLLAWHAADPVSAAEAARNARICSDYQRNRNPFVDHPEWAECIFAPGGACANTPPYPPAAPPQPPKPPPPPSPPALSCLTLTGIIDGPLSGGRPKAVELYAHCDVADVAEYGLAKSTNGGGTGGEPSVTLGASATLSGAVAAGDFFFVASEAVEFEAFFGFAPNTTSGTLIVSGDDAIELYWNEQRTDVFGDVDASGAGTEWDYTDGWSYRRDGTAPSAAWDAARWRFSGKDALDGCATNADCATPFPLRSYVPPAYAPPPPPAFRQEACEAGEAGWQCLCCAQTECAGHFCAHRRCCFPEGESAGEAECERECEHAGDVLVS